MKHTLLGTTALVAAGLVAGSAEANVQLGLGGTYYAAAGVLLDQDDEAGEPGDNTSSDGFRQDVEVHLKGEVTLDNGLVVGATIQLEGQQSSDQIDEVWAYFKGGWGQIRFGDDDPAVEQLAYYIPTASTIFGVDSPWFDFANNFGGGGAFAQTNSTVRDFAMSEDATKVIYFSPTFGGFNFAVSWAPDRRGEDTFSGFGTSNGPGGTPFNNNSGQQDDEFSGALNFEHEFNGVSFIAGIGGAYATWEHPAAGQDDDVWLARGHVVLGFAGFTIGVGGVYQDNFQSSSSTEPDVWVAGIGATYNWDAWTVGLGWSHGAYEAVESGSNTDTLDVIQMTGRYDLGPGVSLDGMVGLNKYDSNFSNGAGFTSSNETWEAGLGFAIGF